MVKEQAYLYAR
jgi:hypothetical protein